MDEMVTCRLNGDEIGSRACENQHNAPVPIGGQDLFFACRGCAGPVGHEFATPTPDQIKPSTVRFRDLRDGDLHTGTKCGHTKPKSEFYPYDPSRCKACIRARTKSNKALRDGTNQPPPQETATTKEESVEQRIIVNTNVQDINPGNLVEAIEAAHGNIKPLRIPPLSEKEAIYLLPPEAIIDDPPRHIREAKGERRYNCDIHGPHAGIDVGGRHSSKCPMCAEEKRVKSIKDAEKYKVVLDFSSCPWVLGWLRDQAQDDQTPAAVAEAVILDAIPAVDMKQRIITSKRKAA